jgi:hypothetical protein
VPFVLEAFGGIAPKINARRLNENMAQVARDCLLEGQVLAPLPTMAATSDTVASNAITIYRYASTWLAYTDDRDIARAPIQNDVLQRVLITRAGGHPVVYSAGASYRVGIPAPGTSPSVAPSQTPEDPNGVDAETVSYVYTFVDAWGAEGPPSPPSPSVDRVRDTTVNLSAMATPPVGNYNFGAGALKRIYRSNAGQAGANYQFVGEIPIATTTFVDNVPNNSLGEVLPSFTWIGPPDDNTTLYPQGPMRGVLTLPNGIMAGFAGNTLCFSEPYLYHAWPLGYRIAFDDDIVGIAMIQSGLLVTTRTRPYVVTGVHPSAMAVTNLDVKQGCVSKRGMVDMGKYAIYPSPDGLVLVEGLSAEVITEQMFSREQWQKFNPSSIYAYEYEGKYIAFYDNGVDAPAGFIFDPRGGANAFVEISTYLRAAYFDALDDTLYVNDNGTIRRWGQGATFFSYTWRSKILISPKPVNYPVVRVQAEKNLATFPVTVTVFADGVERDTVVLNDSISPFRRLAAGYRAKEWELRITGTNVISHIGIYSSLSEAV